MNNPEYAALLEKDRVFCNAELATWRKKLEEATKQVERWEQHAEAITAVHSRVQFWDLSPFDSVKNLTKPES